MTDYRNQQLRKRLAGLNHITYRTDTALPRHKQVKPANVVVEILWLAVGTVAAVVTYIFLGIGY